MEHDGRFFVRPALLALYLGFGLLLLLDMGLSVLTPGPWWRKLGRSLLFALGAIWSLRIAWLALRRPIVAIGTEFLEIRHPMESRASTRIPRSSIAGVAWTYPADLGVRLRDGGTMPVSVTALRRGDRETLQRLLS